ncbi:MAG: 2-C-methyl-D-erythritol 4-phosphate cytidylyltransferase [Candidatus Aphodosoma sp.]
MEKAVIIVAGGCGRRMGSRIPKQFLPVNGTPVLMHTVGRFHSYDPAIQIIVVLPAEYHGYWRELCDGHSFSIAHQVVSGGSERFFSVSNGLDALSDGIEVVGIHDGVRPLVSVGTIDACFTAAAEHGSAVPVTVPAESLRHIDPDGTTRAVTRSEYLSVQTPQCFRRDIITAAYRQPFSPHFTDDASVVEAAGHTIATVTGNAGNIKITTPSDLLLAGILLHQVDSRH